MADSFPYRKSKNARKKLQSFSGDIGLISRNSIKRSWTVAERQAVSLCALMTVILVDQRPEQSVHACLYKPVMEKINDCFKHSSRWIDLLKVFTSKNGSIQTIPSLNKWLKSTSDNIIGLQYIWEYQSPSKSVPPHYQCKLCKVARVQKEFLSHVTGWKHGFRYMKRHHQDKVPYDEEGATKDPAVRKAVKAAAVEVEKTEGRGQIKVVLKEPCEVVVFQGLRSAQPSMQLNRPGNVFRPSHKEMQNDGPFHGGPPQELMFMDPFTLRGGMHGSPPDGSMRRGPSDMGNFGSPGHCGSDREMLEALMQQRYADNERVQMSLENFQRNEGMFRSLPDDRAVNFNAERMMGGGPKSHESSIPATLLKYLDSFRIENEEDAQIVLKVTQKLTDVLMDYRLRNCSSAPNMKQLSPFTSSSCPPQSSDRFSGGLSGPSRFFK